MLTNATHLKGLEIRATDGEIGTVDKFYFDDESWAVRYQVVQTGGWLGGRQVLISSFSIVQADWKAKRLEVALTKSLVENSPDIDTHQPVCRQHEAEYNRYYGYPYYWGGPFLWGSALYPAGLTIPATAYPEATAGRIERESLIRICEAPRPLRDITWKRLTVKSAIWTVLSSTMKPGLSATLRWQPGIGCQAKRYWFRRHGLKE